MPWAQAHQGIEGLSTDTHKPEAEIKKPGKITFTGLYRVALPTIATISAFTVTFCQLFLSGL
jgi:hypothetical protein